MQRREKMRSLKEERLRVNARSLSEQRMRMQLALEEATRMAKRVPEAQPVTHPFTAAGSLYEEASWREAETLVPHPVSSFAHH
jgi:hypothetical protein